MVTKKELIEFEKNIGDLFNAGKIKAPIHLYDENEDNLKDLWLWRVEPISVGDVFIWLAIVNQIKSL